MPEAAESEPLVAIVDGFDDSNLGGTAITFAASVLARETLPGSRVVVVPVNENARFDALRELDPSIEVVVPAFDLTSDGGRRRSVLESVLLLALPALAPMTPRGVAALIRETDVVISKGGHVYRERGRTIGGVLSGWFTMWPYLFARRLGTPRAAYSASIGPSVTRASRRLSRFVLAESTVVAPRDPDSLRRFEDLTVPRVASVLTPDCVSSVANELLAHRHLVQDGAVRRMSPRARRLTVIPRSLCTYELARMEAAARHLAAVLGVEEISVMSQCAADVEAARELAARLSSDMKVSTHNAQTVGDAIEVVARGVLTLSARMHGSIFSLLTRVPTILFDVDAGKSLPHVLDARRGRPRREVDRRPDSVGRPRADRRRRGGGGRVRISVDAPDSRGCLTTPGSCRPAIRLGDVPSNLTSAVNGRPRSGQFAPSERASGGGATTAGARGYGRGRPCARRREIEARQTPRRCPR